MNENYVSGSGHYFPRKAIVTVFLGENIGFEKSGPRPAIVVSNDTNNKLSGNVAIVPLTDETNKSGKPLLKTQYRLLASKYKLKMNSIAQCEDIRSISKARIGAVIDFVQPDDMKEIDKRIKTFFQI